MAKKKSVAEQLAENPKAIGVTAIPKVSENYVDPTGARTEHDFVRPKRTSTKRKPKSAEARFAEREAINAELDAAEGIKPRKRGARYSGEGAESGRLTSTTEYPIPTTKSGGASSMRTSVGDPSSGRRAIDFTGSTGEMAYDAAGQVAGGRATTELHRAAVERVKSAAPHRVEAAKRTLAAFESQHGTPHNAPRFCSGAGCQATVGGPDKFADAFDSGEIEWVRAKHKGPKKGTMVPQARVPAAPQTINIESSDGELCGGSVCKTAEANSTPTPRPTN